MPKLYIVLAAATLIVFLLKGLFGTGFVVTCVAIAYPIYATLVSMETQTQTDDRHWMPVVEMLHHVSTPTPNLPFLHCISFSLSRHNRSPP